MRREKGRYIHIQDSLQLVERLATPTLPRVSVRITGEALKGPIGEMGITEFLSSVERNPDGIRATIPEDWLQGRTSYGGLSASLCLEAARLGLAQERPLRSALIAFVGPASGTVTVTTEALRAGKTAASVKARLSSDAGLGTEAIFTFASGRESALDKPPAGLPDGVVPPEKGAQGLPFPPGAPDFARHFELYLANGALPFSGDQGEAPLRFWTRFRDPGSREGLTALLGLADALPPAITTGMSDFAPLSSMTWMVDVLDDDVSTQEGWYLLQSEADHARGGYSSQAMTVWSSDGRMLMLGRQMVTVFA